MKVIECYNFYKDLYKNYVLIIKSGNFYDVFEDETVILAYLLNYKVNEYNGIKKLGFPLISLNKVIKELDLKKINYLVIEKREDEYKIVIKKRFINNEYLNYSNRLELFVIRKNIVDNIYNKLIDKITSSDFDEIITNIKGIV